MKDYHVDEAWWVSPFNNEPEVRSKLHVAGAVEIHDATLRDGEQTPGVVFSIDDKLGIAEKLVEAGLTRIEAGMPAVSRADFDAITQIVRRFPEARIYAFARALRKDIDMALDAGATGVVIETPIGYPKLKYQFGWTWETVLEKSLETISYAREKGLKAVFFPYDTTRAVDEDLENLIEGVMREAPPDSIGIVDTMGCALPQAIEFLVRKVKSLTGGLPVEVHTHNDFGMAVATELAGVAAGADVVHGCVNGIGERTGNAATEELVLGLSILYGLETPYRLDKLHGLCEHVAQVSGFPVAPNKPLIGSRNYTRESGIGVDLVVKEPLAMFATDPRLFGRTAEVVLGKKSGKASVKYYLDKLDLTANDDQVADILDRVKDLGARNKRLITVDEFEQIVSDCL